MRVLTYDEIDPMDAYRLSLVAFGAGMPADVVRRLRAHRRREGQDVDGFALYAAEGGRVLAQVVPLRFRVRLATGVEEVGGLAGVCSHPAVWGRGYARRLMEETHDRFRRMGLRLSTLTTSRNIRGYGVYAKLGYVDLAPFYLASRPVGPPKAPKGYRLRKAKRSDLPRIHELYRAHTRGLLGWTERTEGSLREDVPWEPDRFRALRMVVRRGEAVGYLRTRPHDVTMDEVVVPDERDFRAAVALGEASARNGIASVDWLTARKDRDRFQRLGYVVGGPIPPATMAMSLTDEVASKDLPRLFGALSGRFVQYPTDDF